MLIAARALHFWAVATLLGGAGFALLLRHSSRYASGLLRLAALVAAVSGLAWFGGVFANVMGGADNLLDLDAWQTFFGAPFGWPWAIRLALCVAAIGLAGRPNAWLCLALGFALVVDQAWLGHVAAAAGPTVLLQFAFYWLHVVAGFLWTGALVMLCALTVETRRVPAAGLSLFSKIGIAIVATIVLTGIGNAILRGVRASDLLTTPYGRLVFVKAILVAAMIVLALVNRRKARRAQAKASYASLWVETALGLAVLAAAAVLGVTPPPG